MKKRIKDDSELDKELTQIINLLGNAHSQVMEALDMLESLERDDKVPSDLREAVEDLEAELSAYDYQGNSNPLAKLKADWLDEEQDEETTGNYELMELDNGKEHSWGHFNSIEEAEEAAEDNDLLYWRIYDEFANVVSEDEYTAKEDL